MNPIRCFSVISAVCSCCLVASAKSGLAQSVATPEVVSWVTAHSIPLTTDPAGRNRNFDAFRPIIGDARVIGLAEAAHGVHEFLAFRNQLARYLIENLGVTAIAAETGYTESIAADDYIQGKGELNPEIIGSVFSWSRSAPYADNRSLLEYLREYNARPATKRKVHFYGLDLSGGRGGPFSEARIALDSALAYVDRVDTAQSKQLRSRLAPFLPRFNSASHDSLSVAQRDALTAAIGDLVGLFERKQAKWPPKSSIESYERAYHQAVVARQLDANFRAAVAESNPQAQREIAMAQNLEWVLDREGSRGRVLIYEASWHIGKGPMASDVWGTSVGEHLGAMLGKDYVAIGAAYSTSEGFGEDALPAPDSASVAATLSRALTHPAVLNLRALPTGGPVTTWFRTTRNVVAGRIDRMSVSPSFDAIIFIPVVHPAVLGK